MLVKARTAAVLAAALVVGSFVPATPAAANEAGSVVFRGGGWGHGVGLSQYGARALASEGRTAAQIVRFYYKDTSLATRSGERIRVLLQSGSSVVVTSDSPFDARAGGTTVATSTNAAPFLRALPTSSGYQVQRGATRTGPWTTVASPSAAAVIFRPGNSLLKLAFNAGGTRAYRRHIEAYKTSSTRIHAINDVNLEHYLRGVVPWEMPSSWHMEALKAQTLAARSYAVNQKIRRRANGSWYDICATTSCQVYGGADAEHSRTNTAISDTARTVITHPDSSTTANGVILATFSSSNGGATENNTDGFGSSVVHPYLVTRNDPWSVHPSASNPFASWERSVSAATIASEVDLDSLSSVRIAARNASGSVRTFEFIGIKNGSRTTVSRTGRWARTAFGLRSIFVSTAHTPPFADDDGHPMEPDIVAIWRAGITAGCAPELFCPNSNVTRAEMATFLARALGLPHAEANHFTDIEGNIHAENINRIREAGITAGCGRDTYCPGMRVTRGEMATFLARALGLPPAEANHFTDIEGNIHAENINRIREAGITAGCATDLYCPGASVIRAHMAAFLARAFGLS